MGASRWVFSEFRRGESEHLARALGVSPVVAHVLSTRGYGDLSAAQSFLRPSYDQLHDPSLMLGIDPAVERLLEAIRSNERILIYGDYDVDGTTGTVVLRRALQMVGAQTGYHVPHRFTEGYGIQQPALERAAGDGYTLVISVDCGIRAHEPLRWAMANGLDVIVTDHHLPDSSEGAPPSLAVINPNQAGCRYPDKSLAGVGVAFKLAHALLRALGRESLMRGFLKMVAIGTVADVAPLVGENRVIVALGLSDLAGATNPGLIALMEVADCPRDRSLTATDVGFRLGPRINAAGRMDVARAVVELFEARGAEEARRLAAHLDARNRERREIQQKIFGLAMSEWETLCSDSIAPSQVAVIAGEGWHRGVIGIAASKISERLNRPCIVISMDGDVGHGSGRSIEAYHLLDGLTECADLIHRFGGHSHAAGLTISRAQIPEFRRRLNAHASSYLRDEDLVPVLRVDAELPPESVTVQLAGELLALEPHGAGNPRPVFVTRGLRLTGMPLVMKDRHLRLRLPAPEGAVFEAVWWGGVEEWDRLGSPANTPIDVAYHIEQNRWRGSIHLQLSIRDVKISTSG